MIRTREIDARDWLCRSGRYRQSPIKRQKTARVTQIPSIWFARFVLVWNVDILTQVQYVHVFVWYLYHVQLICKIGFVIPRNSYTVCYYGPRKRLSFTEVNPVSALGKTIIYPVSVDPYSIQVRHPRVCKNEAHWLVVKLVIPGPMSFILTYSVRSYLDTLGVHANWIDYSTGQFPEWCQEYTIIILGTMGVPEHSL